jgi:hypothetical protein
MSTSPVNSMHSRTYETARLVSDHAGKPLFVGWLGLSAPGMVVLGAAALHAVTRGRVSRPLMMLERPHVQRHMDQMMRRSTAVMLVSAGASLAADYHLKAHSRALWQARVQESKSSV